MTTINYLPNAPKYSTCWYCHDQVEGSHNNETMVRYSCPNHKPLRIEWYCARRAAANKWYFYTLTISLPEHYQLYCNVTENYNFRLAEWKYKIPTSINGAWYFINKYYPLDWVLTQTSDKLLSFFQMYKTFS